MTITPEMLMAVAMHEGAHAVACLLWGNRVTSVAIRKENCTGYCKHEWIDTRLSAAADNFADLRCTAILTIAGPLAESRFTGITQNIFRGHGRGDAEVLRALAAEYSHCEEERNQFLQNCLKAAQETVDDNWGAIEAIAHALIKDDLLTGDDVQKIFRAETRKAEQARWERQLAHEAEARAESEARRAQQERDEIAATHPRFAKTFFN